MIIFDDDESDDDDDTPPPSPPIRPITPVPWPGNTPPPSPPPPPPNTPEPQDEEFESDNDFSKEMRTTFPKTTQIKRVISPTFQSNRQNPKDIQRIKRKYVKKTVQKSDRIMRSKQNLRPFHPYLKESQDRNKVKTIKRQKSHQLDKPVWEQPLPDSDDDEL